MYKTLRIVTARKRSLWRLCFYRCLSVHMGGMHGCSQGHAWLLGGGGWGMHGYSRGVCVVAPGGRAWLLMGACMVAPGGGACVVAPEGACMVAPGGHAWLLLGGCAWLLWGGAWLLWVACVVAPGGVHGCSWGGVHGIWQDTEIRSMSGRYASYWNVFLLHVRIL